MIINQHPEWDVIEKWFTERAAAAGASKYSHVEHITVDSDPALMESCYQMGFAAGQSIGKLLAE